MNVMVTFQVNTRDTSFNNLRRLKTVCANIHWAPTMEAPTNFSVNPTFSTTTNDEESLSGSSSSRVSMNGAGDAVWILTSAFIIFTMISGFGLVESGKLH